MSETAEITSVVDAFDEDDPFDLNLVLGFTQSWEHAKIRRETQLNQVGLADGGFIPATANIASYSASRSTLLVGADVGLYKDLALIFRVPLILSWSQSLGDLNGSSAVAPMLLADPLAGGQTPSSRCPSRAPRGAASTTSPPESTGQSTTSSATTRSRRGSSASRAACAWARRCTRATRTPAIASAPTPPTPRTSGKNRQPGHQPGVRLGSSARTVWSRRFGYVEPYTRLLGRGAVPPGARRLRRVQPAERPRAHAAAPRVVRARPRGRPLRAPRAVPAPQRRLPLQGDVPVAGPRLLRALRRARLDHRAVAAHPEPGRVHGRAGGGTSVAEHGLRVRLLHGHHRGAGLRQLHAVGVGDVAGRRVHQVHRRAAPSRTRSRTS